mgnify:CR=1 FL=1
MHLIDMLERRFYQQEFTLNCLQKYTESVQLNLTQPNP